MARGIVPPSLKDFLTELIENDVDDAKDLLETLQSLTEVGARQFVDEIIQDLKDHLPEDEEEEEEE